MSYSVTAMGAATTVGQRCACGSTSTHWVTLPGTGIPVCRPCAHHFLDEVAKGAAPEDYGSGWGTVGSTEDYRGRRAGW